MEFKKTIHGHPEKSVLTIESETKLFTTQSNTFILTVTNTARLMWFFQISTGLDDLNCNAINSLKLFCKNLNVVFLHLISLITVINLGYNT